MAKPGSTPVSSTSPSDPSAYLDAPYRTTARPELRPSHLATIGRMFGVATPDPSACSYLELGCGDGGNLIPLAEQFPNSRFLGIDFAVDAVEKGRAIALQLGITNITFICGDILSVDLDSSAFDFIACHGVFSWVAQPIRERILNICAERLSPNGVAYISYNVLPGWRQRGVIRDVMTFGASLAAKAKQGNVSGEERLKSAAQFLALVSSTRHEPNDTYGTYLKEAIARLQHAEMSYLIHEYLEEHNTPFLFTEFSTAATTAGLKYLGDAKPTLMFTDDLGGAVDTFLRGLGDDLVKREQAIDFFRNRMFRESLLCGSSAAPRQSVDLGAMRTLSFHTEYRSVVPVLDVPLEGIATFTETLSRREVSVQGGEHAHVLGVLGEIGPTGAPGATLLERVRSTGILPKLGEAQMYSILYGLWRGGFVEASCLPTLCCSEVAGTVRASKHARLVAQESDFVPSLLHRICPLSDLERSVLIAADGSRSQEEVIAGVLVGETVVQGAEVLAAIGRLSELGFFVREASVEPTKSG